MLMNLHSMLLEITLLKLLPNLPRANKFKRHLHNMSHFFSSLCVNETCILSSEMCIFSSNEAIKLVSNQRNLGIATPACQVPRDTFANTRSSNINKIQKLKSITGPQYMVSQPSLVSMVTYPIVEHHVLVVLLWLPWRHALVEDPP